MIVMKFGGTSVEDARSMKSAIEIVGRQLARKPVIVASAIAGATNQLLNSAQAAFEGRLEEANKALSNLHERHVLILENVVENRPAVQQVLMELKRRFEELKNLCTGIALLGELTPRSLDSIASTGERLSSLILAEGFRESGVATELVDARKFMVTDDHFGNAAPLLNEVEPRLKSEIMPLLQWGKLVVTQGYIGVTQKNIATTLGRGGSDYSAAVIGALLNAEEIQIWTDVDGVMTADPRIAPAAKKLKVISFQEASELAYFGAKVLHPSTILPAVRKNIPVVVLNSKRPQSSGTRIVADPGKSSVSVKSIASKRGITVINVQSTRMLMAYGFLESIFSVFRKHKTAVDLVCTSEVAVSLTIDNTASLPDIVRDLQDFSDVTLYEHKAILCLVGEQMHTTAGIADRIFHAIGDINVMMVSQGASEINMSLVIDEQFVPEAVRRLHKEFFEPVPEIEIFETVAAG